MDLFADAQQAEEPPADAEQEEGNEPEDDFNAAWEVLDVARSLFEKQGDDEPTKFKLAETFMALGDVSLETGASDYLLREWETELIIFCF